MAFDNITVPGEADKITVREGGLEVSDNPILAFAVG